MTIAKSWLNTVAAVALVVSAGAGAFATAAGASASSAPERVIAGGYQEVAVTDPGVRAAAQFGVAHMRRPHAPLARINAAWRQVVAGMNYRIDVTLTNGSRWRLSVYRPLRGPMQLRGAERLRMGGERN